MAFGYKPAVSAAKKTDKKKTDLVEEILRKATTPNPVSDGRQMGTETLMEQKDTLKAGGTLSNRTVLGKKLETMSPKTLKALYGISDDYDYREQIAQSGISSVEPGYPKPVGAEAPMADTFSFDVPKYVDPKEASKPKITVRPVGKGTGTISKAGPGISVIDSPVSTGKPDDYAGKIRELKAADPSGYAANQFASWYTRQLEKDKKDEEVNASVSDEKKLTFNDLKPNGYQHIAQIVSGSNGQLAGRDRMMDWMQADKQYKAELNEWNRYQDWTSRQPKIDDNMYVRPEDIISEDEWMQEGIQNGWFEDQNAIPGNTDYSTWSTDSLEKRVAMINGEKQNKTTVGKNTTKAGQNNVIVRTVAGPSNTAAGEETETTSRTERADIPSEAQKIQEELDKRNARTSLEEEAAKLGSAAVSAGTTGTSTSGTVIKTNSAAEKQDNQLDFTLAGNAPQKIKKAVHAIETKYTDYNGETYGENIGNDDESKYTFLDGKQEYTFLQFCKYGEYEKAQKYLESIDNDLVKRKTEYWYKKDREKALEPYTGWIQTLVTVPENIVSGLITTGASIGAMLGDKELADPSNDIYRGSAHVANTRDVRGKLWGNTFLGDKLGPTVYGTVTSLMDMFAAYAVSGGLSTAGSMTNAAKWSGRMMQFVMSSEAAGSSYLEELKNGRDPKEAAMVGLASGAIEALTEKYSIEIWLHPEQSKKFYQQLIKSTIAEGSEEAASDILNAGYDMISSALFGHETELVENSNAFEKQLWEEINAGKRPSMTADQVRKEAENMAVNQWLETLGLDALAGAASGFAMGGITQANYKISQKYQSNQNAKATAGFYSENVDAASVLEAAKQMGVNQGIIDKAYSKFEKNGKLSPKDLLQVTKAMSRQEGSISADVTRDTMKQSITEEITSQIPEGTAINDTVIEKAAEAITENVLEDKELTVEQQEAIDFIPNANEIIAKLSDAASDLYQKVSEKVNSAVVETINKVREPIIQSVDQKALEQRQTEFTERKANVITTDGTETTGKLGKFTEVGPDAKVEMTTANGEKVNVSLKDATAESSDVKAIYDAASQMNSADGANAFVNAYSMSEGMNLTNFARGFSAAMDAGMNGTGIEKGRANLVAQMPEMARNIAYSYGQQKAMRINNMLEAPNEVSQSVRNKLTMLPGKGSNVTSGVVLAPADGTKISTDQAMQLLLLDHYAKAYNKKVTVVSGEDIEAQGYSINANESVISLNSTEALMTQVAGHEWYHGLKRAAESDEFVADQMKEFDDIALKLLQSQEGYDLDARIAKVQEKYNNAGQNLTREEAMEELLAQESGAVFSLMMDAENTQIMQQIANEHPTLIQRIKEFLGKFIDRIRASLETIGKKDQEVRAALNADMKVVEDLYDRFSGMLSYTGAMREINQQSAEEQQAASNKNTEPVWMSDSVAEINHVSFSKKDNDLVPTLKEASELTEEEAYKTFNLFKVAALKNNKSYDSRYYAINNHTPKAILDYIGYTEGHPMVMYGMKLRQAFLPLGQFFYDNKNKRHEGHGLSPDGMKTILADLEDPLLKAKDRFSDRCAFVVNNPNGKGVVIAFFDFNDYKNNEQMSQYKAGDMNVMVTLFRRDSLESAEEYIYEKNGYVEEFNKDEIIKNSPQSGLGVHTPALFNGLSKEIITSNEKNGNKIKTSFKDDDGNTVRLSVKDNDYLSAVEDGDMETAQKMVDEAAKENGYNIHVYHGTPTGGFTEFMGWSYFTENKDYAERYRHQSASSIRGKYETTSPALYDLVMNPGRVFDTRDSKVKALFEKARMEYGLTDLTERGVPDWTDGRDLIEYIEENDLPYDTIILDEGGDGGYGEPVTWRGFSYLTNSERVKSTDPVTYDNNGNVIPLSQRFNTKNKDIRYSVKDNDYLNAVEDGDMETAQKMVDDLAERTMKNSKIRDDEGNLLKVYHGTDADFTVFDMNKGRSSMDIQGAFFSPWDIDAEGYGPNVRAFYLDIKNPAPEGIAYRTLHKYAGKNGAGRMAREDLIRMGYDGVNNGDEEFIAFYPEQIKSADAVTHDDNGNVIPLGKRFNTENKDIRYSVKDNDYMNAAESGDTKTAQQMVEDAAKEAFPNSVLIQDGKFHKMWHHTNAEFTEFLPGTSPSSGGLKGIYFTPQENSGTANLGKKHGAYYLNVQNLKFAFGVQNDRQYVEELRKRQEGITDRGELARINREFSDETGIDAFFDWQNGWYNVLKPELIKSADPVTYDNDGNVIPLSERFNTRSNDIRYSVKDNSVNEEMRRVLEENTELKKQLTNVLEQLNGTGARVSSQDVHKLARRVRSEYGIKMPQSQFEAQMERAMNAIAESRNDAELQTGMEMLTNVCYDALSTSESVDDELYKRYEILRNDLRTGHWALTEQQWQEGASLYGSEAEFRRAMFGKWGLAKKGTSGSSLDGNWEELCSLYPEFFDKDTNEGDMVATIINVLDNTAKKVQNPFGMHLEESAADLAMKLFGDMATEVSVSRGTSAELNAAGEENRILAQENQRLNDMVSTLREATRQDRIRHMEQTRRGAARAMIIRSSHSLLKKLEGTSSSGVIPEEMKDAVTKILKMIDVRGENKGILNAQMINEARAAYESLNRINGSEEDYRDNVNQFYNGDLIEDFNDLARDFDGKPMQRLALEDLQKIQRIVSGFAAAVNMENKLFADNRREDIMQIGNSMIETAYARKEHLSQGKIGKMISASLGQGLLKPVTVQHMFEGTALQPIWENVRKASDKHFRNVDRAETYLEDSLKEYGIQDQLDEMSTKKGYRDSRQEVELVTGRKIYLNKQEAMTIYAVNKREHLIGTNHLLGGGIKLRNIARGESMEAVRLTAQDIKSITDILTDNEKKYVDHMVEFITRVGGEWGNEVTRKLYGVDKYNEEYYIPLEVDHGSIAEEPGVEQDKRIVSASFTKQINKRANSAITITPFTELWCSHVERMSDFNAFALPLQDFTRVMNFREDGITMKNAIARGYGANVQQYIMDYIKRLNGNSVRERGGSLINQLVGKAKGASVTFNASVAIQQMGAGVRAMSEISPVYYIPGMAKGLNVKKSYAEMRKYAAVGINKDWGYFDTASNRSLYTRHQNNFGTKLNEWGGKLAEKGDQLNWAQTWEAVKNEQRALNQKAGKATSGEEFLQQCGERFTEIVDKTQVVDSIQQRAAYATEKGLMSKAMAFMSEPVTMYNMLYRDYWDIKDSIENHPEKRKAAIGHAVRSIGAIVLTNALTAALKSIVTAMRDRDDEKKEQDEEGKSVITGIRTFGDKYMDALLPNFFDNIAGIGTIFTNMVNDSMSSMGSSDLSIAALQNFTRFMKQVSKIGDVDEEGNWNGDPYKLAYYGAQTIANLTGVGAGGLVRDMYAAVKTVEGFANADELTGTAWDSHADLDKRINAAAKNYAVKKYDGQGSRKVNSKVWKMLLYEAYVQDGEKFGENFSKVSDAMIANGGDASYVVTAFKDMYGKNNEKVKQAAEAMNIGDFDTAGRLMTEMANGGLGLKVVTSMVNTKYNAMQPNEEKKETVTKDALDTLAEENVGSDPIKAAIKDKVKNGSLQEKEAISQLVKNGISEDENSAYWSVQEWLSGDESYSKYGEARNAAASGDRKALSASVKTLIAHGVEPKQIKSEICAKVLKKQYLAAGKNSSEESNAYNMADDALRAAGFDENERKEYLKDWQKEKYPELKKNGAKLRTVVTVASAGASDVGGLKMSDPEARFEYYTQKYTNFDFGTYGKGNIDLNHRKVVHNDDGSISTERSFSVGIDGYEVLLPTVINGRIVSEDEAIDHYFETGEYLGKFKTVEEAEAYAEALHNRQDKYYNR